MHFRSYAMHTLHHCTVHFVYAIFFRVDVAATVFGIICSSSLSFSFIYTAIHLKDSLSSQRKYNKSHCTHFTCASYIRLHCTFFTEKHTKSRECTAVKMHQFRYFKYGYNFSKFNMI